MLPHAGLLPFLEKQPWPFPPKSPIRTKTTIRLSRKRHQRYYRQSTTLPKAGITYDTMHVINRFPAEGTIETAKARGCDLIVMAVAWTARPWAVNPRQPSQ